MRGVNSTHYIGSLTQDASLKYTPGGLAILELTVAGKQQVVTAGGEIKALPFYNRAKCFGKYAETLAEGLKQGEVVSVLGRLEYRQWEEEGGAKRSTVETVISSIQVLAGRFVTTDDSRGQPLLEDGFNQVTLGGNLTREPELKHLATGSSVLRLALAVNESYSGKNVLEEKVGYYDLQAWGELAEVLAEGRKGQGLIGVGRLINESWTDKEGTKRYGTKVELERAHFVAGPAKAGKPVAQAASKPAAAASKGSAKPPLDIDEEFPPDEDLPF